MNPWKIIGWIVLGFLVLMLAFCGMMIGRAAHESSNSAEPRSKTAARKEGPTYSLQVVSLQCISRHRDRADITVRNTGATTIPFTKAFVQFKDKAGNIVSANDSYFSPHSIPAGATASADVYSSGGASNACELVAIQDGDGNQVSLSQ